MPAPILIVIRKELVKNFGSIARYCRRSGVSKEVLRSVLKGERLPSARVENILMRESGLSDHTRIVFLHWAEREKAKRDERKKLEKYEAMSIKDLKLMLVQVRQVLNRKENELYRDKAKGGLNVQ